MAASALAIPGRREQAIDQPRLRGRTVVGDKRRDLFRRRRESGQVEVMRRIKVRRSAVAAGVRPLDASATLMNRSTGVWAQGSDKRSGGYDGFSGRNDQWSRWASVTITSERPDLAFAAVSGQVAPSDTQRLSTACSPAGRRSPSGGIRTWESSEAIRSKRALALESPGTIAGSPESPPTHAELRVSSRSPPRCLSGPWHLKHAREERAYLCGEIDRPEISAWLLVVRSRDTRQRESDSQRFGEC
jgi:hypothetical protein